MFLGEYQHVVDAKGRVSLPAKFRKELTGDIVVAKGLEKCLYVFPADAYNVFLSGLMESNDFQSKTRNLRRFFAAGAAPGDLDGAGRVSIPQVQREYAGLDKNVAVIGNGDRIEIWDAEAWARYSAEVAANIESDAEGFEGFGLL